MRSMPVIAVQPFWQIGRPLARMAIGASIGPLAQCGLDEALGCAVGARRIAPGKDVPQAPAAASGDERQRAEYLGVVGHDAAHLHTQVAVVARSVIHKGGGTRVALGGTHLGKADARAITDGNKGSFIAGAPDMIAPVTCHAMSRAPDASQLLAVDM